RHVTRCAAGGCCSGEVTIAVHHHAADCAFMAGGPPPLLAGRLFVFFPPGPGGYIFFFFSPVWLLPGCLPAGEVTVAVTYLFVLRLEGNFLVQLQRFINRMRDALHPFDRGGDVYALRGRSHDRGGATNLPILLEPCADAGIEQRILLQQ